MTNIDGDEYDGFRFGASDIKSNGGFLLSILFVLSLICCSGIEEDITYATCHLLGQHHLEAIDEQ